MMQISEVNIFSLSKDEDGWTIEGEIIFEDDLTSAFEQIICQMKMNWKKFLWNWKSKILTQKHSNKCS